jgi:predicted CoA-binding protein
VTKDNTAENTAENTVQRRRDLTAFFSPRSVVMVGASERSSWSLGVAARFKAYAYEGKVYAVNRNGVDAHGYPGYKSCKEIGQQIDFAYLMVPAEVTLEALTDVADAGIKHVSILTSGFAEIGEAGVEMQQKLLDFAQQRGITLMGRWVSPTSPNAWWRPPSRRACPSSTAMWRWCRKAAPWWPRSANSRTSRAWA